MSIGYSAATSVRGRPPVMDRSGRPQQSILGRIDWVLMAAVLGLGAIGAVLVWSATRQRLLDGGDDPQAFLKKPQVQIEWGLSNVTASHRTPSRSSASRSPRSQVRGRAASCFGSCARWRGHRRGG